MRSLWLCVVAATGCGFKSTSTNGNQVPPDAIDAPGDSNGSDSGTQPTNCIASWRAGTIKLETPTAMPGLQSSTLEERDPWVTADGLELYYTYQPVSGGIDADIYHSTRASTAVEFPVGTKLSVSQSSGESRASLTADGKTIAFSSDRAGGMFQIYLATRDDPAATFQAATTDHLAMVNSASLGNHFDPFLTKDGLELYYAPTPQGQHIYVASRSAADADFGAAIAVPVINQAGAGDADPALSSDRLVIVFSSDRPINGGPAKINLWYATRDSAGLPFGPPKLIPNVNSDEDDGDPSLSEDGCTLYFSTTRDGSYDLYRATVGAVAAGK